MIRAPETFHLKDGRDVVLRTLEPADAPALLPFYERVGSESTHTLHYPGRVQPPLIEIGENLRKAAESPTALELGAFDGPAVVGLIGFTPFAHRWMTHAGSFRILILEAWSGGGLGRRMLAVLDEHAREAGITRIEAFVRTSNERAIGLYRTAGYEIEGTRRRAARIDGAYQDSYYIAKLL